MKYSTVNETVREDFDKDLYLVYVSETLQDNRKKGSKLTVFTCTVRYSYALSNNLSYARLNHPTHQ